MYIQHTDHCIEPSAFGSLLEQATTCAASLSDLPAFTPRHCSEIKSHAQSITSVFKTVVVLGTGGSTLCPQAFTRTVLDTTTTIIYADYVGPHATERIYQSLDLASTHFIVTSKSGGTLETIAQYLWWLARFQEHQIPNIGKHFTVITDPKDSPIRDIATQMNASILPHEEEVGGRYAAFTNVGLLPAAIAGMNIDDILLGAQQTIHQPNDVCLSAAMGAHYITHGKPIHVFMPYTERLKGLSALFRQLWAESLGKDGKGSTPVTAIGTLDQHSQLQLYLDGPDDKYFTLLTCSYNKHLPIASHPAYPLLEHRDLGDISQASARSTIASLAAHNRPVRHIEIDTLDDKTIGALVAHVMIETILVAHLLEVNAFDQPAVEQGKQFARDMLKEAV